MRNDPKMLNIAVQFDSIIKDTKRDPKIAPSLPIIKIIHNEIALKMKNKN